MIALAVLVMLLAGAARDTAVSRATLSVGAGTSAAAVPADTAVRIPGTTLRLGLPDAAVSARGFAVTEPGKRHGTIRFFGMVAEAALELEDGRLARVTVTVEDVSPYEIAYVQDQLLAMGYKRRCAKLVSCDWSGPVAMHIELVQSKLTATASRPARPAAAERDTTREAHGPSAAAPPAAAPTSPSAQIAAHTPAETTRAIPPRAPASSDSLARPENARVAAAPAPMLPETLAVVINGRPSGFAAAEVRHEGHCEYPAGARRAGIQGRVWVLAAVDTSGEVVEARISRGIPELNAAALCAARLWLFAPRAWQGRPCRYRVLVPITFTLH